MDPYYADDWLTVYQGDCRAVMAGMEPESVHCVVTSPPYWGLRDYGETGQLGLESTPEAYVANMVAVFREVRRVLRSDGTVWLNLGDSYFGTGKGPTHPTGFHSGGNGSSYPVAGVYRHDSLKEKDLVGIPWRVAFALQADGWYLRSDIIWAKPNPMPESVTDRPTKAHEYLFLLSKSPRYYFDADAVREPADPASAKRYESAFFVGPKHESGGYSANGATHTGGMKPFDGGRNIRSVWTIATAPYPGAHFATFPPKLVEPCIKAGCPDKVCRECGAPWERVVERVHAGKAPSATAYTDDSMKASRLSGSRQAYRALGLEGPPPPVTVGWRQTCDHHDIDPSDASPRGPLDPVPGIVLDPFAGSGTTGMVAQSLSRRAVLIDLNAKYLEQAMGRNRDIPLGLGA